MKAFSLHPLPKAVIFDVDGTLYDQPRLRRQMAVELVWYLMRFPLRGMRIIKTLTAFRALRERLPEMDVRDVARAQYDLTAKKLCCPPQAVRDIVQEWMFQRPLRHLRSCKMRGLDDFLTFLDNHGVATAVFSDYPAQAKLQSLDLDIPILLDAEDPRVDRLKPNPRGLLTCAELLQCHVAECVFVGDRDDRDGECAKNAGMPYLLYNRRLEDAPNSFQSYGQLLEWFRHAAIR